VAGAGVEAWARVVAGAGVEAWLDIVATVPGVVLGSSVIAVAGVIAVASVVAARVHPEQIASVGIGTARGKAGSHGTEHQQSPAWQRGNGGFVGVRTFATRHLGTSFV